MVWLPRSPIEELLECPWHLHILVVPERCVQLGQDEVEGTLVLGKDGIHLGLQLSPGHTMQAGEDIQHCFLALVLQLKFPPIEVYPLSPLAVVRGLVAEDGDVRVLHELHP